MNSNINITEDKFARLNQMLDAQLQELERSQKPICNIQKENNYQATQPSQSVDDEKVKYEMEDLQTKISKLEHQFNKFSTQEETESKYNNNLKRNQFTENIQLTEDEDSEINGMNQKFEKKLRGQSAVQKDYYDYNAQLLQSSKKREAIQHQIHQAENQLNLSRYSINQDSNSKRRSTRQQIVQSAKKVAVKHPRRNSFGFAESGRASSRKRQLQDKQDSMLMKQRVEEQIEEENKIRQLENQISKLKRERNKVQEEIRIEKLENKKTKESIDKFNKQVARINQNVQTNEKMQEEFDKLAAFFEKSESIRKSQKALIINLREELEGLKSKMEKVESCKTIKKVNIGKKKKKAK